MMCQRNNRSNAIARGYTRKWRSARRNFLTQNPLCSLCEQLGRATPATVVDHITPHGGDEVLFWDEANWQSLCKHCHDSVKQKLEKSGVLIGSSVDGKPLDPNHHWND
jgi:5-methylcytosine-specific restriction endonuclease McrA